MHGKSIFQINTRACLQTILTRKVLNENKRIQEN